MEFGFCRQVVAKPLPGLFEGHAGGHGPSHASVSISRNECDIVSVSFANVCDFARGFGSLLVIRPNFSPCSLQTTVSAVDKKSCQNIERELFLCRQALDIVS